MTSSSERWFQVRAGELARHHLERHGLSPGDIGCMPAAAGAPKGLALLPFDRLLAREWLTSVSRLELIGASIDAWRMMAIAQTDANAAIDRDDGLAAIARPVNRASAVSHSESGRSRATRAR